ncbi:MAG: DUF1350 family protein [Pseudomonadota bacterium]
MPETPTFERVGSAWVARNPANRGVIEFYGGAIFERCPTLFYEEYLEGLFQGGYNIVAFTFPISFNHTKVAEGLVQPRKDVFAQLSFPVSAPDYPHFWVGHSIGCKIISLVQILITQSATENAQQPTLLLAPDISGTKAAVPGPLAAILDWLGLGVKPTEPQTKAIITQNPDILSVAGLISFADDSIAGNADGTLPKGGNGSVEWFIDTLSGKDDGGSIPFFTHAQLLGKHLAPLGYDFEFRIAALLSGAKRRAFGRRFEATSKADAIAETSVAILEQLRLHIPQ